MNTTQWAVIDKPISICPDYIAPTKTRLRVTRTQIMNRSLTILYADENKDKLNWRPLFEVHGSALSFISNRRYRDVRDWTNAETGEKIFQSYAKSSNVWGRLVERPSDNNIPCVYIKPRYGKLTEFRDMFDVYIRNVDNGQDELKLEVRGESMKKVKTHVYWNNKIVMDVLKTDIFTYHPYPGGRSRQRQWEAEVVRGFDLSLAGVILAQISDIIFRSNIGFSKEDTK